MGGGIWMGSRQRSGEVAIDPVGQDALGLLGRGRVAGDRLVEGALGVEHQGPASRPRSLDLTGGVGQGVHTQRVGEALGGVDGDHAGAATALGGPSAKAADTVGFPHPARTAAHHDGASPPAPPAPRRRRAQPDPGPRSRRVPVGEPVLDRLGARSRGGCRYRYRCRRGRGARPSSSGSRPTAPASWAASTSSFFGPDDVAEEEGGLQLRQGQLSRQSGRCSSWRPNRRVRSAPWRGAPWSGRAPGSCRPRRRRRRDRRRGRAPGPDRR